MDKSNLAIAIGSAAAVLSIAPLSAGAAPASPDLFQPIPNAAAADAQPIQTQWYHHRWRRHWGYGYYRYDYGRPYWWHRHHRRYRYYYYRRWY